MLQMLFSDSGWMLVSCRLKANSPLVGFGPIGGVPSVEVFLRDPSSYLREFRRKPPSGLGDKFVKYISTASMSNPIDH